MEFKKALKKILETNPVEFKQELIKEKVINSIEHRRKISEAMKGKKNHLGKQHSEESKRKIGKGNKGKVVSEETKQKMSISQKKWRKEKENESKSLQSSQV
jgi:hypothetical protein